MKQRQLVAAILLFALCGARAAAQDERFSAHGFFDVDLNGSNRNGDPPWSFDVRNLNVISAIRLDSHWRLVGELEWEHEPGAEATTQSGEIVLERAYVEYRQSDRIGVIAGKFLTPFGLYNLRHDVTPSFVSIDLASSVYGEHDNTRGDEQLLFAKFGAGLQLTGNLPLDDWNVGYAAYLVNGRGPSPYAQDNNPGKGVGARFTLQAPGNRLQVGTSYYADRNGEVRNSAQSTIAVDVTARGAGFLVESEGFAPRLEIVTSAGALTGRFRTGRGFYVQVSRPVVGRTTAYARYDSYDPDVDAVRDAERDVVAGLNFAVTGAVYLKSELHFRSFENKAIPRYQQLRGAVAIAF